MVQYQVHLGVCNVQTDADPNKYSAKIYYSDSKKYFIRSIQAH